MDRRTFLSRVGIGGVGVAVAPIAALASKAQQPVATTAAAVARQITAAGGKVHVWENPNDGWYAWIEGEGGEVTGYIHESGKWFARVVSIGGR